MTQKRKETKQCASCNTSFDITDKDLEFYEKVSPVFDWKKYNIPTPRLCPECRMQRRMTFRNERNLFKRKCDATGREIVSIHSPDKKYKVYESDFWWSDKWDPITYALGIDFEKSFISQIQKLQRSVPKLSIFQKNCEDSPYSHFESDQKNCYMTVWWHYSEDTMYGNFIIKSKKIVDSFWAFECENCYECVNSYRLHACLHMRYSYDSYNCILWYDLKWCSNCIWCIGLRNKEYCIFNKQYTKQEYDDKKKSMRISSFQNFQKIKREFETLRVSLPHKYCNIYNSENCNGDDIFDSKNIDHAYLIDGSEDCKHVSVIWWAKKSMDAYGAWWIENMYECMGVGLASMNIAFSTVCFENHDVYYSDYCFNSSHLFGCVWLKNKEYCILNKQYTKQEYNKLVPKIIEHMKKIWEWWEFFPSNISPFWYNETVVQEYFPLKKEKVVEKGWNWSDYERPHPKVDKIISAKQLPDTITDIPDDILNWAIECELTKKPFRTIKPELEFYRKHNLPIPRRHPDQRHLDRMKQRNPRKLFERKCDKCDIDMKTTYSPERPEKVYCEECYNKEIY